MSALSSTYEHGLFLTETFAFLDEFATAGDHPSTVHVPPFTEVRLDHVSFRYPSADRDAISDIDLEVKAYTRLLETRQAAKVLSALEEKRADRAERQQHDQAAAAPMSSGEDRNVESEPRRVEQA